MSRSRFALLLSSSVRLWVVPVVLTVVVCSGCESDDEDDGDGDSSSAIEHKVLLEVAVRVQPNVPLLNGEDEALMTPAHPAVTGGEAGEEEDVLAALASGAAVQTGASPGSGSDGDSDDE